jgi:hypothetical protein
MAAITDSPSFLLMLLLLLLAGALSAMSGCGGGEQMATYSVGGEIVYTDGSPVNRGLVQFRENNSSAPTPTSIEYGDDGKFELSSDNPNFKGKQGLPEGEYQVIVMPEVPDDRGTLSKTEFLRALHPIDTKYRSYNSSGLKFKVSTDPAQNHFKIEVRRPRR